MKRLPLLLSALLLCVATALASGFADETLSYRVMFKWGLINKQAGTAVLTLRDGGDSRYHTRLTAASEPWADRIYRVRDTLVNISFKDGFRPEFYEKIAHEGNEHKHDVVRFTHHPDSRVTAKCTRRVHKDGRLRVDDSRSLEATGPTVDMLSSFYYMRSLPFDKWQPGHHSDLTIFSGKRKERLSLSYRGIETVTIDGHDYRCHRITFIFTGDGGKKTSDDMDAWITADARRLPVKLEGKLPVGKVQCFLVAGR